MKSTIIEALNQKRIEGGYLNRKVCGWGFIPPLAQVSIEKAGSVAEGVSVSFCTAMWSFPYRLRSHSCTMQLECPNIYFTGIKDIYLKNWLKKSFTSGMKDKIVKIIIVLSFIGVMKDILY